MSEARRILALLVGLWSAVPAVAQSRVIHVPLAEIPARAELSALTSIDHRGDARGHVSISLGPLAQLDLGSVDWLGTCHGCAGALRDGESEHTMFAQFKAGLPRAAIASWSPPLTLGLRKTFSSANLDAASLFAVTGVNLMGVGVGLGVEMWSAAVGGEAVEARGVRPLASVQWRPPRYPRTKFVADLSWVPIFDDDAVSLSWIAGWGVEYDALPWLAPTLTVRHREQGAIGDSLVLIGVRLRGLALESDGRY